MSALKLANHNGKPEIFHSIQGEGKNLGQESVFIRLSLCNLYCKWCDTDYTWNWIGTKYPHNRDADPAYEKFDKSTNILSLTDDDIMDYVRQYNCKNIVLTGGEPLVQHKSLAGLCMQLKDEGCHIEVETNGTIVPNEKLENLLDQYNVSVKLSNSGVNKEERIVPDAVRFFAGSPKSNFKFVLDSVEDLNEVLEIIKEFQIDPNRVYLMPQGINVDELQQRESWVRHICEVQGFHFTTRKHIEMFGSKRGV